MGGPWAGCLKKKAQVEVASRLAEEEAEFTGMLVSAGMLVFARMLVCAGTLVVARMLVGVLLHDAVEGVANQFVQMAHGLQDVALLQQDVIHLGLHLLVLHGQPSNLRPNP